jgi:predicted transcriptional regulator of viral defense system
MKKADKHESAADKARRLIEKRGGTIRTADALNAGIHPRTVYQLRDSGELDQVSRGVFRLSVQEPLSNPDLVTVALRVPRAVVCLVSALAFHGLTTQIPRAVAIALERGAESPRIDYPPVSVHRFSGAALTAGIEEHKIDGVPVRIYSAEKTLADCFKYRNKIGMDVVLEALRFYKTRKNIKLDKLLEYGRMCRVERVMKPYLEATV